MRVIMSVSLLFDDRCGFRTHQQLCMTCKQGDEGVCFFVESLAAHHQSKKTFRSNGTEMWARIRLTGSVL